MVPAVLVSTGKGHPILNKTGLNLARSLHLKHKPSVLHSKEN